MRSVLHAGLAVSLLLGCDSHSIPPPKTPHPTSRLEVGPVLTDKGVDIGPAIVDRVKERGLADAHVVAEPSGSAPYVDGKVHLTDADRGFSSGLLWSEVSFLVVGGLTDLVGALLVGAGASQNDPGATGTGGAILGVGLVLTGIGVLITRHPARYMDATVHADLTMIRDNEQSQLNLTDTASVYHDHTEPQVGASKLLDGVINGMCRETSK